MGKACSTHGRGELDGKIPLEILRRRWADNITRSSGKN
jgi:hypothetical protein